MYTWINRSIIPLKRHSFEAVEFLAELCEKTKGFLELLIQGVQGRMVLVVNLFIFLKLNLLPLGLLYLT